MQYRLDYESLREVGVYTNVIWILNGDCAQNLPPFAAATSVDGSRFTTILLSASMIGENRQLVTDEPVEFEK